MGRPKGLHRLELPQAMMKMPCSAVEPVDDPRPNQQIMLVLIKTVWIVALRRPHDSSTSSTGLLQLRCWVPAARHVTRRRKAGQADRTATATSAVRPNLERHVSPVRLYLRTKIRRAEANSPLSSSAGHPRRMLEVRIGPLAFISTPRIDLTRVLTPASHYNGPPGD